MGCGGQDEEKKSGAVEVAKSPHQLAIEKMIKDDAQGNWVFEIYEEWPVDGEPTEVDMPDGKKRKTWVKTWAELEATMAKAGISAENIAHIKAETVDNAERPLITAECVTWPAIQNLTRECWVGAMGKPWVRAEHAADGAPYRGLLRSCTLKNKTEGMAKMLAEMGEEKFQEELWEVYVKWDTFTTEPVAVTRYNRKKMAKTGEAEDCEKITWPLPFEGEVSITSLLTGAGWNEEQVTALKTELIDQGAVNGVHPNCTEAEITWPDLQQVFRETVTDAEWTTSDDEEWPVLCHKVSLRNKIDPEKLKETLEGEFRMYCKPDSGEPFSYGLIIDSADPEAKTFTGKSRTEGKYAVENGTIEVDEKTARVFIEYDEVWPNGQRDHLRARMKSNKKFQCESADGFEQKATNESANLPEGEAERIGEVASEKVKKYYLYDQDAASD